MLYKRYSLEIFKIDNTVGNYCRCTRSMKKVIEAKKVTRNQEIALNLLAEGIEIKLIVKITGLSEEEISKL